MVNKVSRVGVADIGITHSSYLKCESSDIYPHNPSDGTFEGALMAASVRKKK